MRTFLLLSWVAISLDTIWVIVLAFLLLRGRI